MSYYIVENNILGKTKPQIKRQRVIPVKVFFLLNCNKKPSAWEGFKFY